VRLRPPTPSSALPWSILNYVYRSREKVLLADAAAPGPFAADEYVVKERAKSVLCLPILRQAELIGVLYLENDLVTDAFSPDRLAVLELLAAQVAISMENALLLAKEQAARAAAEAAERRSAFVAHELKTPLGTVELRLSALAEAVRHQDTISSASLSPSLTALKRQFDRMNGLIESLLESARVQTGQLTLTRQELDLTAVIRDVVDLLAEQAERYGCQLQVDAPGPVRGKWDRLRLEQVVTNLLNNGFKYGAGKPIRIAIDSQGTTARFSVTDQGIGISEADQARLFEPFARATELHQRQSLGVGLYLVREIVRAHGGRVHLRSQPGAGTTFIVELPVDAPS
jgi:signal transduction histidine kinase